MFILVYVASCEEGFFNMNMTRNKLRKWLKSERADNSEWTHLNNFKPERDANKRQFKAKSSRNGNAHKVNT